MTVKPQDHDGKPTHEVINELYPAAAGAKSSNRALFVKVDVTVSAEVENIVQEAVREFGRLDMYVCGLPFYPMFPACA